MTGRNSFIVMAMLILLPLFKRGNSEMYPRCGIVLPIYNVTYGAVLYRTENELSTSLPTVTCCIYRYVERLQPYPLSTHFWFFQNTPIESHSRLSVLNHVSTLNVYRMWIYRTIVWPRTITKDIAGIYKCSLENVGNFRSRSFSIVVGAKPKITFIT
eukprot:scpid103977/ scgid17077/ 